MFLKALSLLLGVLSPAKAANNGLALTPQMGWNTWNHFGCSIDESLILGAAKAIIQNNLSSLGYQCTTFTSWKIFLLTKTFRYLLDVLMDDCELHSYSCV
jgi:hypothetical protein